MMKASLFGLILVVAVTAHAQSKKPALAPVQLIPAAAVVKPSTSDADREALRQLRQAEAEMKVTAPVVVKPVLPNTSSSQQLPSIPRPVVKAPPVVVAPRPVVVSPRPRFQPVGATDSASLLAAHCLKTRNPLRCMNEELNTAELRVDSAEVRLLNCREIRKFDTSLDKNVVDSLVTGRMYQLRFKETQAFNTTLAAMGSASKMQVKEAELRATLSHLNAVAALGSKVCNASAFAALYAEAKN